MINLVDFVSSVSSSVGAFGFPTEDEEAKLMTFYASLSRDEKVQVHKVQNFLERKFLNQSPEAPAAQLSYACFILALKIAEPIHRKEPMNLRRFIVDGDLQLALTELPDFESAKVDSWIDKNKGSGPQKSTREALKRHRNTIRRMIQQKVSTRQISAFLKEEYDIRISHSTISRNTKFIFKD